MGRESGEACDPEEGSHGRGGRGQERAAQKGGDPVMHCRQPQESREPFAPSGRLAWPLEGVGSKNRVDLQTSHVETTFSLPCPGWAAGPQLCPSSPMVLPRPLGGPTRGGLTAIPHSLGIQCEDTVRSPCGDQGDQEPAPDGLSLGFPAQLAAWIPAGALMPMLKGPGHPQGAPQGMLPFLV